MSTQEAYLTDIANAIREKEGSSEKILAFDFADRIKALPMSFSGTGIPPDLREALTPFNHQTNVEEHGTANITVTCSASNKSPYLLVATTSDPIYAIAILLYDSATNQYNGTYFQSSGTFYGAGIATYTKMDDKANTFVVTWAINPTMDISILSDGIYVTAYEGTKN